MYVDFDYYVNIYKGTKFATEGEFSPFRRKASNYIRQCTYDRIPSDAVPESAKMCCCELAEQLKQFDENSNNINVSSEHIGDLSISYASAESQKQAKNQAIKDTIHMWLLDTGLLYRGVCDYDN